MKSAVSLKQAIEDAVIGGEFAPGHRLDENSLAVRFGVSRTPVREALLQLGAEGFIEMRPRRGAVVSVLSPPRIIEMFEMMAELEASCGRLAARRLTPTAQNLIVTAHEACVAAANTGDSEAYYDVNRTFHESIYQSSRNAFMAEQARSLHKRLSAYRRVQLRMRGRLDQSIAEHSGIVQALVDGEADLAATMLRNHVLVQGERFTDMMLHLETAQAANQRSERRNS